MSLLPLSRKRRTGFSLVEVVLALGVVAAAVLALIGILGSTFSSAREIAMQHKAINVITQIDGALQSASGIVGLPPPASATAPAFDRIYSTLAGPGALDGTNFVDFFVYQKTIETPDKKQTPAVPVIFFASSGQASGQFTLVQAKSDAKHDGIDTASVFRVRVRVSHLLDGKLVNLDRNTYEADPTKPANAGAQSPPLPLKLPQSPDDYALAYLPLTVEIYPHDFTDATDPGTANQAATTAVKPVLTAPVVINR